MRVEIGGENICRRLRDLTQGITGRIKKRHSSRVECSAGVPLPDPILIATDQSCGMFINEFRKSRRQDGSAIPDRPSPEESPAVPVALHEHHRRIRGHR